MNMKERFDKLIIFILMTNLEHLETDVLERIIRKGLAMLKIIYKHNEARNVSHKTGFDC